MVGVKKDGKESRENHERSVLSMLKERLGIENVEIKSVHRAGRKSEISQEQ